LAAIASDSKHASVDSKRITIISQNLVFERKADALNIGGGKKLDRYTSDSAPRKVIQVHP